MLLVSLCLLHLQSLVGHLLGRTKSDMNYACWSSDFQWNFQTQEWAIACYNSIFRHCAFSNLSKYLKVAWFVLQEMYELWVMAFVTSEAQFSKCTRSLVLFPACHTKNVKFSPNWSMLKTSALVSYLGMRCWEWLM